MSLHFVIDGYNLIKQTPALNKDNLEDSRAALIKFLNIHRPQGSGNNQVTIVFDGKEGNFHYEAAAPSIEVIFSIGQSADDKIRRLVEESPHPKTIVVVTNDREIQLSVRQLRAQVRTIDEFLKKSNHAQKLKQKTDKKNSADEKVLSYSSEEKINEALKRIWLKS